MSRVGRGFLDGIAWTTTRILFRVDAQGLEKIPAAGPFILVSNHISGFELPVLRTLVRPRRVRTLAKAESWDRKLIGWVFNQWGSIPVRRGEFDLVAFRTALQVLADGGILGIMPEGTRSGHGRLGRGNPGAALIALRSACPIVPMAFWGVEQTKVNLNRIRRTRFHLRVGDPVQIIPPADKVSRAERQKLADDIMRKIAVLLPEEYRGVYGSDG